MIKKSVMVLLVLTFLNIIITPNFAEARSYKPGYPDIDQELNKNQDEALTNALIITGIVVVGVIIIYLIAKPKKTSNSAEQSGTFNQTSTNIISNVSDKLLTPSGNLVVVQW